MKKIKEKIEKKAGLDGVIDKLTTELSHSELNSFYIDLFGEQSRNVNPAGLLKNFSSNRFVFPSKIDMLEFLSLESQWLSRAAEQGFKPIILSPLTPLGTCSSVAFVHQNNIVSASRNTEVVSDATNVLALQTAADFKHDNAELIKYSTVHRHMRAQGFTNPAHTAHFGAFSMVSGGLDSGNHSFELEQLQEHLLFYTGILNADFKNKLIIKIYYKKAGDIFKIKFEDILKNLPDGIEVVDDSSDNTRDYYQTVRIKIFVKLEQGEIDLADMGFVDWTQKLLNNKKHRFLISGAGLELLYKIKTGLVK